jgi:hypothetical protein
VKTREVNSTKGYIINDETFLEFSTGVTQVFKIFKSVPGLKLAGTVTTASSAIVSTDQQFLSW